MRPGEMEALAKIGPEPAKRASLVGRLDTLGDGLHVEGPAQADDRSQQRELLLAAIGAAHERPVDLEHVDREPVEVAERGISGPEVVDREPDAERLERAQRR